MYEFVMVNYPKMPRLRIKIMFLPHLCKVPAQVYKIVYYFDPHNDIV